MNYGRFFRLNQRLSKVENGVAIYDYIDLPAYFGPSVDNPMSPKYPISVTITSDIVSFRLHYSAFKIENSEENKKKEMAHYAYDENDIDNKVFPVEQGFNPNQIGMAHMEETILELPFQEISRDKLSDIIKKIYTTNFPQIEDEGGRYLEQLIKKRFPIKKDDISGNKGDSVEQIIYRNLRKVSDETASYSTLWLMDLLREDRIYLYSKQIVIDDKTKKKKLIDVITGFLRKLLLDFMFDLKHSDVFQNSAFYQKMYSGLMSDFYFSALMHKCEYYYYRKLTRQAIAEIERDDISIEIRNKRKKTITTLYASELISAEDLWVQDIMNPQAEKDFEYRYPGKHNYLREIIEHYSFQPWPSWFAEPEEEMRRVCFTMREKNGEKHICNADTLLTYLNVKYTTKDERLKRLLDVKDDNREIISKWFLRQYNFQDVLHLHWFKFLNILIIGIFAIPALYSLFSKEKLVSTNSLYVYLWELIILTALTVLFSIININKNIFIGKYWRISRWRVYKKRTIREFIRREKKSFLWRENGRNSGILVARWKNVGKRFLHFILLIAAIFILLSFREQGGRIIKSIPTIVTYGTSIIAVLTLIVLNKIFNIWRQLISSLHLFLPRLVASITLAWITLSMGFDLYVSYFDYPISIPYVICIVSIVMLFVMYEINRITPHAPSLRKFIRSLELMIISYLISLCVGFVVINFLGEKYLERGGYINEYYTQYVENEKDSTINRFDKSGNLIINKKDSLNYALVDTSCTSFGKAIILKMDSANKADNDPESYSKKLTDDMTSVFHSEIRQGKITPIYPVAAKIKFWGLEIFILRDFLVMFAFIAMFTGIFIQLIIFGDNKQMTEL